MSKNYNFDKQESDNIELMFQTMAFAFLLHALLAAIIICTETQSYLSKVFTDAWKIYATEALLWTVGFLLAKWYSVVKK